ncbi:NAC domain-containing protein 91-like [Actinidia eriantha]|uniref:NAC domain-containing protein 91-like n=1 Tax=Actinidia eriantha TaxID=165200 RepID=UPI002584009E|nr:NAC domain-containing protein 91-like [Actinidia eriantha]XP_057472318.1 NAC domain-containing protein 91-like [Actinidia eriantha]
MAILALDSLPVGYRFRPTEEELVNHFLRLKINGDEDEVSNIRVVDLCKQEPWDLPDMSLIETNDDEWIFFCPIDRKYKIGRRKNRATVAGYWKATGKDRSIKSVKGMTVIGKKKTLVFYTGRAPNGKNTNWVIHEYCGPSEELDGTKSEQGSFVLCKLIKKHNKKLDGKQDENAEHSNCDDVEGNVSSPAIDRSCSDIIQSELVPPMTTAQNEMLPFSSESCLGEHSNCDNVEGNVSSPAIVRSFSEVIQSELVTPTTTVQNEMLPFSSENWLGENCNRTTLDAPLPTESPNNGCIAHDAGDKSTVQAGLDIQEMLKSLFPDPMTDLLDGHDNMLSPLNSQMQVECGSSYNLQVDPMMDHAQKGTKFQYEPNDGSDDFLNSIIVSLDEDFEAPNDVNLTENVFLMDGISCSDLDGEVA